MTLGEWLDSRTPAAPPALAARIRSAVGDDLALDAREAPRILLALARDRLDAFLMVESASRVGAGDLLLVDALVTYAFEAASDAPDSLDALALDAMESLGARAPAGSR